MDLNAGEAATLLELGELDALKRIYGEYGLKPGGFGLPVDFRRDEESFQKGLAALPRLARAAAAMGCLRCPTWLLPFSNDLPFAENFDLHRRRLRACAEILKDSGVWLGLEFVGPKTMRVGKKHEFIWNMAGMLELADAIGTGNVGLLLDCWHWYTAGGTVADILALRPQQIVYTHVNDAPAGVDVDAQVDNVRRMPGETGVIDIAGFLGALAKIGYDGPLTAEPFVPSLKDLSPLEACRLTSASLDRILAQAGL
ncbi:MAG: sugar phosphate isomerase/epimerase [Planctomycetes bacterium]|nr:sugar phosphate isomerase/epimerase [Planctomycetota bacterium]